MSGLTLADYEVAAFLIVAALIFASCLWGRRGVVNFLNEHATIAEDRDLSEFKTLVRRQMWVAVGVMCLGMIYMLACILLTKQFLLLGLLLVLAVSIPIILLARSSKKLETKARTLTCANLQLQTEYEHVALAWTKSLFPDF